MITKTVAEMRVEWGDLIKTVSAQPVEIRRSRGRPADRDVAAVSIAVLVPFNWYDTLPAGLRPAESQVLSMRSSEARAHLFDMVESAIKGVHTLIKAYGRTSIAVVVPYDWYIARAHLAAEDSSAGKSDDR